MLKRLPVSSDRSKHTLLFPYPALRFILVSRFITAHIGLQSRDSFWPYFTVIYITIYHSERIKERLVLHLEISVSDNCTDSVTPCSFDGTLYSSLRLLLPNCCLDSFFFLSGHAWMNTSHTHAHARIHWFVYVCIYVHLYIYNETCLQDCLRITGKSWRRIYIIYVLLSNKKSISLVMRDKVLIIDDVSANIQNRIGSESMQIGHETYRIRTGIITILSNTFEEEWIELFR